jgi:hypothetical protein
LKVNAESKLEHMGYPNGGLKMYYVIVIGSEIDSATDRLKHAETNALRSGGTIVTFNEYVDTVDKMYVDGEVVDIPLNTEELLEARREERRDKFVNTLDRMNPVWHNSLTAPQQNDLATWRTQWLEYPSTGIIPDDTLIQGIFESDLE